MIRDGVQRRKARVPEAGFETLVMPNGDAYRKRERLSGLESSCKADAAQSLGERLGARFFELGGIPHPLRVWSHAH